MTKPRLLLSLQACAELAHVQRPVVSMWRKRLRDSDAPFPAPLKMASHSLVFDGREVAEWLNATGHGNNADADADLALYATIDGFDFADTRDVARAASLIALRALLGRRLADIADIPAAAAHVDPEDRMLRAELAPPMSADQVAFVDAIVDADFSPGAAFDRLLQRASVHRSGAGPRGPLTANAAALAAQIGRALALQPDGSFAAFGASTASAAELIVELARGSEDLSVRIDDTRGRRMLRRRLAAEGIHTESSESRDDSPLVHLARFPEGDATPSSILDAVDELALAMTDRDRAVAIGPSEALTDPLDHGDRVLRSRLLRSGRVRGIVRLPAGLVVSAPRQSLALWVLGREYGDVPIDQRYTVIADLSDVALTPATGADIVSDLVASLGDAAAVRGHAFRFARFVRTATLLAAEGGLVERATPRTHNSIGTPDIAALLEAALAKVGDDLPLGSEIATGGGPALAPATLGTLAVEGRIRVLSGTRVDDADLVATGFGVVGLPELLGMTEIGARAIDRLNFATAYPRARLTEPGDVVFCASPRPQAWVDVEGAHVVAYPARILRVRAERQAGLVPEILARDICALPATSRNWRRWAVRRVRPGQADSVRTALQNVDIARSELGARLALIDHIGELLADGAASGAITISPELATEDVA